MRYKILIFLMFLICLFSYGLVNALSLPLLGKVIYIDPGHGGKDPGAIAGNVEEATINLEISYKLQKLLEKNGAIVYMTRYGDYDLSANNVSLRKRSDLSRRVNLINESDADMYISIHLNADVSENWSGAQIFYSDINGENKVIGNILQKQLKDDLNSNRKLKKLTNQYMYKRIKVKGVLAEVGFITNSRERYLLKQQEYQYKIANTLCSGIVVYYTEVKKK